MIISLENIGGMQNKDISKIISIISTEKKYPNFPYDDSKLKSDITKLLAQLGLDPINPFGDYVKKGGTVLIKPNWVRDYNPKGNFDCLVTHTSIIKNIMELLVTALQGQGRIIIGDAPLQNCNFDNLIKISGFIDVVDIFKSRNPGIEIIVEDWRLTLLKSSDSSDSIAQIQRMTEEASSQRYSLIDLAEESFLEDISDKSDRFRVTKYKPSLLKKHHSKGKHEYLVTKRIFEVDFVINLPKLKTHIKAGITGALKNLVGINGHKEFLPHHIKGSSEEGGDNYKYKNYFRAKYEDLYDYLWENFNNISVWKRRVLIKLVRVLESLSVIFGKEAITAGSWSGNDTIWRTTLDLNHILYFKGKPKKVLNIVDGVIAGEGDGPLEPLPKPVGVLIAGENPALVDAAVSKLVGYKIENIKTVSNALYNEKSKFRISPKEVSEMIDSLPVFDFKKPKYWQ